MKTMKNIVYLFFIAFGISLGYQLGPSCFLLLESVTGLGPVPYPAAIGALIGAILFALILASRFVDYILEIIISFEDSIKKTTIFEIVMGAFGMLVGLLAGFLLQPALNKIPAIGPILTIFISIILGYTGLKIAITKHLELAELFQVKGNKVSTDKGAPSCCRGKILDTSVIIDGRIADICNTGFVEGMIIIPNFVLVELQHIADSSDSLKRARGRRGLDILKRIQKELKLPIEIWDQDYEDINEVDSKLVRLAKDLNAQVVTNDYNLNKVCELHDVPVLNINELANAVKPVVIPGEEMHVQVIKDGKEHGQGVAYLDDGTMIVVEGGTKFIGDNIDVIVTSVLQTAAGRMIFAKPK